MNTDTFDIQRLIQESGVARRTIHFYVQQGIIPPPAGAGLAAYYTTEHLLRLQMIPLLRREGLRLDEIRERLAHMTADEMKRRLAEPAPLPSPAALRRSLSGLSEIYGIARRKFVHYTLPDGVTVMAPGDLSGEGELRLRRLLEAAAQIYQGPIYWGVADNGVEDNGAADSGAGSRPLDQNQAEEE